MKFAFCTCVQLGLSCIEEIYSIGGRLDLLITLNDNKAIKKSGRIYLDEFAVKHKVPLVKCNNVNDQNIIDKLKEKEIDYLFIIGWSQIAKKELLEAPKLGCIGMHPTLLPKGRGRASIPWAIIKGLDKTGVTMFKLDDGVDTGDIIGQIEIPITKDETATSLYQKVDTSHIQLMKKYYPLLKENAIQFIKQDDSQATYWEGRRPEDGEILCSMDIETASTLIRAVNKPYPGAFFINKNKKVIVWKAKFNKEQVEDLCFSLCDGYLIPEQYEVEEL